MNAPAPAYGLWGSVLLNSTLFIIFGFLLGAYVRQVRHEESEALARFGEAYRDYQRRTPAFFPGFGRKDAHGQKS